MHSAWEGQVDNWKADSAGIGGKRQSEAALLGEQGHSSEGGLGNSGKKRPERHSTLVVSVPPERKKFRPAQTVESGPVSWPTGPLLVPPQLRGRPNVVTENAYMSKFYRQSS